MSAVLFIFVNSADPGFDPTIDGKTLSHHFLRIDSIANELEFELLAEYCSQSKDDAKMMMADLMGWYDEEELPHDASLDH